MDATIALRESLLKINDSGDLDRLPYGTIIVSEVRDYPGIFTLIKTGDGDWCVFTVYGEPGLDYTVAEEDYFIPKVPALLVCCGETLPHCTPKPKRHLSAVKT